MTTQTDAELAHRRQTLISDLRDIRAGRSTRTNQEVGALLAERDAICNEEKRRRNAARKAARHG